MDNDSIFGHVDQQFGSRQSSVGADRYDFSGEPKVHWAARERQINEDISAGPEQTVAGFAWEFDNRYVQNIKSQLAYGDFAAAKASYDNLVQDIDLNRADLLSFSQIRGAGVMSDRLAQQSERILSGAFNQEKVTLADGTETTVGAVLSDLDRFNATKSEDLRRKNFSDGVINRFLSGDSAMQRLIRPVMEIRPGTTPGDQLQIQELANAYNEDYDRVTGLFGDGTSMFLSQVLDMHKTSGNAAATMRSLVDLAENYGTRNGVSGTRLATEITTGYNDLLMAVMKSDDQVDGRGQKQPVQITDNQRRMFDAMLIPAVNETLRALGESSSFDFYNPAFRRALAETADVLAYSSAARVDLFSECRRAGVNINKVFGEHGMRAVTGVRHPSTDFIQVAQDLRREMTTRITGGRDAATIASRLTGSSADYIGSVSRTTGTQSMCPEADNLAAETHQYLFRELMPMVATGMSIDEAASTKSVGGDLSVGLRDVIARSFHGNGKMEAARAIADVVLESFLSGREMNFEDAISRTAFDEAFAKAHPDAAKTLRNWYHGNIVNALQFGREREMVFNSYLADGLNEKQARRATAIVSENMSAALDRGDNPSRIAAGAIATGPYLKTAVSLRKDANGNVINDSNGKPMEVYGGVVMEVGDRRGPLTVNFGKGGKYTIPENTYFTDPGTWEYVQNELRVRQQRERALADYQEKKALSE